MTYELSAQEVALIEAYRGLYPLAQEHISGFVIPLAKLHTIAQRSGRERKPKREAVEGETAPYELTKPEAAFLRAYRKLPQMEQGYVDGIVPGWGELTEFARRNALEWQKRQGEADKQK